MDTWDVHDLTIKDVATPQITGPIKREKVVTFYLGNHGPFTERFPADGFKASDVNQRIEQLRNEFRLLTK